MPAPTATGWRRLLWLRPELVDFSARGFRTGPAATRTTLEAAAGAFLTGFNAMLLARDGEPPDLSGPPDHRRGFAVEGAAMAAVLLDTLVPDRAAPPGGRRFTALLTGEHRPHVYLMYVGAGWATAKLHRRRLGRYAGTDPLLCRLAHDGWGFCRAFFADGRALTAWERHSGRCDADCAIRYQGYGRHLWFRECGSVDGIAARIARLPERHRGDAWAGTALAAVYAGGVEPVGYPDLARASGRYAPDVAQGAAFGAEAWRMSGVVPEHARPGVEALTGVALEEAAGWTWTAREGLDPAGGSGEYQRWRAGIRRAAERASR